VEGDTTQDGKGWGRHETRPPAGVRKRQQKLWRAGFLSVALVTLIAGTTAVVPHVAEAAPSGFSSCHARGTGRYVLPDPRCTPGATNPSVAEATIHRTICTPGWTSRVRPPESYTEALKRRQMIAYGDRKPIWGYEEDHLIPLELGGSPTSALNLWPESGASPNPKDAVEDVAHHAVCSGRMSLLAAQRAIATNWITLGHQLGVR
jgi:hypothetical protein